jgi:signal transduction histidine kinase
MTSQLFRVNLSIASPSEIERTARQLRAMREGFLTTGSLATLIPRSLILESWQRCHAMNVNPSRRFAPLAVARESQLYQVREANELLVRATHSVMGRLTDFLAGSGYVIVLSDAKGVLLDVLGDAGIRRRLARIDFVPGGDWSEAAAGTNAIGTALADRHVVQLMAAEHYCDGWTDLTCTAAPIRHPFTGEVIGVLDVTGDYRLIRSFLTNSLAAAALEVQQELRTLLTSKNATESQTKLQAVTVGLLNGMNFLGVDINHEVQGHHSDEKLLKSSTVSDMWSRLDLQERRTRDAELLAAAAGAISASLDLQVTLENVAEQAGHLLQLENAAVFLFDETGEATSPRIWSRDNSLRLESLRDLEAMLGGTDAVSLVRERGEPVIIDDIFSSTTLSFAFSELTGIRSLALLPLVTARGVIGFIAAPRSMPYNWETNDVRLGLALAAQSATAIENARLFSILQQHNRRIEVLNAMAQLLSSLPDPNQHLELVLKRVAEIMDLDAGIVLLLDQNTDSLTPVAHCGLPGVVSLDLYDLPLRPLYEIACLVAATRESLLTCCEENSGRIIYEPLQAIGFSDLMAVPLLAGQTILGVLLVGSQSPRGLTDEDLALFTTIGQQLGLTLKNAQLLRSASEMDALREADRLKSGFIAAVSHDLRSPLTAIRASVESLLDRREIQLAREHDHLLHNIAGQTSRLGRLVDQLLDLSRIEAGALSLDRDWTELPVLIADTLAKFEELNNGCQVERDLSADLPLHYVDPDRLIQVLWNLLENANKYASPRSSIKVETRWTGTEVLIGVADRGPGIPSGEHEKIFQHFYRLDRDYRAHTQGSGLGLAICRGIVQAHGGRIWVEDRPGGGSIFYIALPLPPDSVVLEGLDEPELYTASTT